MQLLGDFEDGEFLIIMSNQDFSDEKKFPIDVVQFLFQTHFRFLLFTCPQNTCL